MSTLILASTSPSPRLQSALLRLNELLWARSIPKSAPEQSEAKPGVPRVRAGLPSPQGPSGRALRHS